MKHARHTDIDVSQHGKQFRDLRSFLHPASAEGVIVLESSVCVCVSHPPGQTDRHTELNLIFWLGIMIYSTPYMNGRATMLGVF